MRAPTDWRVGDTCVVRVQRLRRPGRITALANDASGVLVATVDLDDTDPPTTVRRSAMLLEEHHHADVP